MDKRNTVLEDEAESLDADIIEARELEKQLGVQRAEQAKALRDEEIKQLGLTPTLDGSEQTSQVANEGEGSEQSSTEETAESQSEDAQGAAESTAKSDSDEPLTVDDRLDLLEKQFGLERTLVQAEREDDLATITGLKRKLDQRAGDIGALRQEVTRRGTIQGDGLGVNRASATESKDLLAESAEELSSQPRTLEPVSQNRLSPTDMYAFKAARTDLLDSFINSHPSVVVKDEKTGKETYHQDWANLVTELEKDYEVEISSGDFNKFQEAISDIMNGAFRKFDIAQQRAALENVANRTTAAEQNQKAGLATAISNSSGSGASASTKKEKNFDEMTIEEAEAVANADPNRGRTASIY